MLPDGDQIMVESSDKVAQPKVQKMMVSPIKECCVPNCKNVEDEYSKLHPLPERPDPRWHKWLYACNRVDVIKEAAFLIKTRVKYFVCSHHFEDHMFQDRERTVLVEDAEPTIFNMFKNNYEVSAKQEDCEMNEEHGESAERQPTNCLGMLQAISHKLTRTEENAASRVCSEISLEEIRSLITPEGSDDSADAMPSEEIFGSFDSFSGMIDEKTCRDADNFSMEGKRSSDIKSETDSIEEFESRSAGGESSPEFISVKSSNNDCERLVPTYRIIKNQVYLSGCLTYVFDKKDQIEDGSYPVIPFLLCHENEEKSVDTTKNLDGCEKMPEISYKVDSGFFDDFEMEPNKKVCRTLW